MFAQVPTDVECTILGLMNGLPDTIEGSSKVWLLDQSPLLIQAMKWSKVNSYIATVVVGRKVIKQLPNPGNNHQF